jgi:anti-sigma factor RsiW
MSAAMTCSEAKAQLLPALRGRLSPTDATTLDEHLRGCEGCRRAQTLERATDDMLSRLPRPSAPASLRRSLERRQSLLARPSTLSLLPAAAAAALLVVLIAGTLGRWHSGPRTGEGIERSVSEAVNDHLRQLYRDHPLEVESGGIHQVKPWFTGRLDFAPSVAFEGDDDFVLQGGAVGYFIDRKAAVLSYRHKLHQISLMIVPAEGLSWPGSLDSEVLGRLRVHEERVRGFSVVLWRDGDLGYALVSDLNLTELKQLANKIGGG